MLKREEPGAELRADQSCGHIGRHCGSAADSAAAGHAYEKPERAVAFGVLSACPSGLCAVPGGAAVRKGDKCICGKQGEILKDSCGGKGEADQGREKQ